MNILEFLLANPIIALLIIGAITSIFGRKSKEEEQKKRQQQRKQTQQAETQSSYPDSEVEYQEPKEAEQKPRFDWDVDIFQEKKEELEKKVRETLSPYLEKKKEQALTIQDDLKDRAQELSIKRHEISGVSPILNQELKLSEGKVVKSNHRISHKRVVEGVMWAEVLGQPRSRNPHRPIYKQHYSSSRKKA